MHLFLVHHGHAVGPEVDPRRPLSAEGRKAVDRLAASAASRGARPSVVWHSGKLRAKQTAEAYWRACNPFAEFAATRDLQPGDSPEWIRDRLRGESRDIMIAGHYPHLPGLLQLLLGDREHGVFPQHGAVALVSDDQGETWRQAWRISPDIPTGAGAMNRVLEPEAMDTADEAREYDAMDHAAVNARFVADLLDAAGPLGMTDLRGRFVVDVGTGTARIPIEFCRAQPSGRVVAVDLALQMLRVARQNVLSAGLSERIALQIARATAMPLRDASSPMVVSNSLIHHLPDPAGAFREMARIMSRGGVLFVRDLFRPPSQSAIDRLVDLYAAGATDHQRQLLADSLRAALTVDEVRDAVGGLPFAQVSLAATSDRHWTLAAVRA